MTFRSDIAGLRAWAVVAVVLYHFGVPFFSGGFVGVDIFFVISGYLMAGIVLHSLSKPNQSRLWVLDFYLRRGLRIIPAMIPLFLAVLVWGWFWLDPWLYKDASLEGLRALIFRSNVFFADGMGYFDRATHERLFLHTWSLAVEWTFYLIFPLACALVWAVVKRVHSLTVLTAVGTFASFAYMLHLGSTDPTAAFYSLSSRAWEMGLGALCYYLTVPRGVQLSPKLATACEWLGFALILTALCTLDAADGWPNWSTLIPVIGTALVLVAAKQNSWLTAPKPFQFLGQISYSLYLWHWPIAVALIHMDYWDSIPHRVGAIALSGLMGWASLKLVELPVRDRLAPKGHWLQFGALFGMILLTALPWGGVRRSDGVMTRLDKSVTDQIAAAKDRSPLLNSCVTPEGQALLHPGCLLGEGKPALVLFGDSHADAAVHVVNKLIPTEHSLHYHIFPGCNSAFGQRDIKTGALTKCSEFLEVAVNEIKKLPAEVPLLMINRMPLMIEGENALNSIHSKPHFYLSHVHEEHNDAYRAEWIEALGQGICRMGEGRTIYVTEPVPDYPFDPLQRFAKASMAVGREMPSTIPRAEYEARVASSRQAIARAGALCGAEMISVADIFCDDTQCRSIEETTLLYRDDDHLSLEGANLLEARLLEYLASDRLRVMY